MIFLMIWKRYLDVYQLWEARNVNNKNKQLFKTVVSSFVSNPVHQILKSKNILLIAQKMYAKKTPLLDRFHSYLVKFKILAESTTHSDH